MGDLAAAGIETVGSFLAPAAEAAPAAAEAAAPAVGGAAEAAIPAFETGFGSIGSGLGGAGGFGDFAGTGAGMFGGATGMEGTALSGGFNGGLGGLAGAGAATAGGTAADFMMAPGASAFSPGAVTPGAASFGPTPGAPANTTGMPTFDQQGNMMGNITSAQGQAPANPGASSPFSTGANPVPGLNAAGTGSATPFSAPSGVTAPDIGTIDPTAAASAGTTPGATPATPGATPGATPTTPGGGSGGGILSTLKDYSGLAGVGIAGAGLANNLLNKNNVPGQAQVNAINSTIPQLQGMISNVNQQAQKIANSTGPLDANTMQMLSYVNNGQLPPAMQAQVDNGVQAAKAAATSAMASRGMPTDPASNPQLASQLTTIDSQALEMKGNLETQLYQAGLQAWQASNQTQQVAGTLENNAISATGLDLQTYMGLQSIYQNQSNQEQAAIGNLAQALGKMGGGGNNTLTIKTGS